MNILIVGNVLKDVYLDLDGRTEQFETDKRGVKWLNVGFDTSEHRFFHRESSFGGAAISLEVLTKMGVKAEIVNSAIQFSEEGLENGGPAEIYRYILLADEQVSYLVPTQQKITEFTPPTEAYDYVYVDRSAELNATAANRIATYLDVSPNTKLVLYVRNEDNPNLNRLIPRASLVFAESNGSTGEDEELVGAEKDRIVRLSEKGLGYQEIFEPVRREQIDKMTHLSTYSIGAATVLGSFVLGNSVEESLKLARANIEGAKLNTVLGLTEMQDALLKPRAEEDLALIAQNLVLYPKGILAADESGGSIHKKFGQMNIPDTYENRRDYRNIFFTTEGLETGVNGVILFDETARQLADNGQNFVEYLIARRVIPGIKVDQGLEKFEGSPETYTKGLEGLDQRLAEYYAMGLRFAKWRAAFEIHLNDRGEVVTPTERAIEENCRILAEYAHECQKAGLVPIVEPEVVYDGYYDIDKSAETTGKILDKLFSELKTHQVKLEACILKVNMVLAGKQYEIQSTPTEVGMRTAEVLKEHVPGELAGVVFLSGGQTPEQATENLAEIVKNGPFPWPVTFSYARALQGPALEAWGGNNENAEAAREAFRARLDANVAAVRGLES